MNKKRIEAIVKVEKSAKNRAKKAGREEPNILDRVPAMMTADELATIRLAFGIK